MGQVVVPRGDRIAPEVVAVIVVVAAIVAVSIVPTGSVEAAVILGVSGALISKLFTSCSMQTTAQDFIREKATLQDAAAGNRVVVDAGSIQTVIRLQ